VKWTALGGTMFINRGSATLLIRQGQQSGSWDHTATPYVGSNDSVTLQDGVYGDTFQFRVTTVSGVLPTTFRLKAWGIPGSTLNASASGNYVNLPSTQQVVAKTSGQVAKVSGETVSLPATQAIKVSGETVSLPATQAVKVSGELMTTKDLVPATWAVGTVAFNDLSGGAALGTTQAIRRITMRATSGDVYVGTSGVKPYIGYGLAVNNAAPGITANIDNILSVYCVAATSGDTLTYVAEI
jgi:hypothetical protein